jgi:glycosyltransferase involved in cell wall biosynthesis
LTTDNHSIFVIVPGFNEAYIIRQTIEKLLAKKFSVIVVDDASTDNTREVLLGLPVYYIRHLSNLGQGAAIRTGIEFVLQQKSAEYVVTFDADGQHDADDIERMLEILKKEKADIIFGSRFLPGSSTNVHLSRKWVLKIARLINYLASGILLSDANNGLRVMTKEAALKMQITENRSTHNAQVQNLVKYNKIRYAECPVNISYSEYSRKKGLRNINSVRILYDLILFKIFR